MPKLLGDGITNVADGVVLIHQNRRTEGRKSVKSLSRMSLNEYAQITEGAKKNAVFSDMNSCKDMPSIIDEEI